MKELYYYYATMEVVWYYPLDFKTTFGVWLYKDKIACPSCTSLTDVKNHTPREEFYAISEAEAKEFVLNGTIPPKYD